MKHKDWNGHSRGFTIVELLVVVSIIALLIGILLPAIGKARDSAMTTQSLANLRNLSAANAAYSANWNDRQWTTIPDDLGLYNGIGDYIANPACPPQQILGWDQAGVHTVWGYFLGSSGLCSQYGYPGGAGNYIYYIPNNFVSAAAGVVGSYRLCNVKSFNSYMNGRFYDPVFYAPKDTLVIEGASKYFSTAAEFTSFTDPAEIFNSSYCFSPAAMWAPEVLSFNKNTNKYYTAPTSLPSGYKSPAAGLATYPDLKTRMLEHSWLQNKPGNDVNYHFNGDQTPWYFNHGLQSSPATLFFDGHVQVMSISECMAAHDRTKVQSTNGGGLWSEDTPHGNQGYYGGQSYDFTVKSGAHIFTIDGILGRDTLGLQ